ncbi:MAG: DHH family phosphoesterase [Clostridia bacterium]|nr:DHH family phosphoesterase [Clostridia bacterium]
MEISVKQAAAFLLGCDGYLIYTHASPDGDTVGSATALAKALRALGKRAFVFSVDGVPEKLSFMYDPALFIENEPESLDAFVPISVDVAGPKTLGKAKNKRFELSIDHHKTNDIDTKRLLVMSERIACGEIIFILLKELGVSVDRDIATSLYAAISSDSGGFRYSATTADTHRIAAELLETGIDFAEINRRLFECKTPAQVALTRVAYRNLELLNGNRFAMVGISPEEVLECGADENDFDCINQIPREINGVAASAVIRMKNDSIKVSLRSNADIDVAELAKRYGGGGHFHAAGFNLDCGYEDALAEVRKLFSEL